jgi:hypothetical protein
MLKSVTLGAEFRNASPTGRNNRPPDPQVVGFCS